MQPPIRHLLAALLAAACLSCAASAQTIRALGYNTTNGQVIANTGTNVLTFTNGAKISANDNQMFFSVAPTEIALHSAAVGGNIITLPEDAAPVFSSGYYWNDPSVRASFGFSTNLTGFWTATNAAAARSAVGLGETNSATFDAVFALGYFEVGSDANTINFDPSTGIQFGTQSLASQTRTNLGLPLPALTNTSNVTMMRALAGSTNTNEPYSGVIQYADSPTGDTYEMTVSNGIILKIEMQ